MKSETMKKRDTEITMRLVIMLILTMMFCIATILFKESDVFSRQTPETGEYSLQK